MKEPIDKFYEFLGRPIRMGSRPVLAALTVPLALAFLFPLWNISMVAPQYPQGLSLDVYLYKVEGGREGRDIQEINVLNHYIGMQPIDRAALTDLDWLPFAMGFLIVVALRCAAIGNVRILIDLVVISGYVSAFALGRFVYKLWVVGHELDPKAPIQAEPFMPAVFGTKQIANFTVTSFPRLGTVCVGAFVLGVALVAAWHLYVGRRDALREMKRA